MILKAILGWAMDFLGIYDVVYGDCQFPYKPFITTNELRTLNPNPSSLELLFCTAKLANVGAVDTHPDVAFASEPERPPT